MEFFFCVYQVLKYVPVMARPLVLGRTDHPTIWTPVYADITDPKIADWLWEQRENNEQKDRFLLYHRNRKAYFVEEQRLLRKRWDERSEPQIPKCKLMTSVSMPVFDRRENAVRFSFISYYSEKKKTNIANWPTQKTTINLYIVDEERPKRIKLELFSLYV
jgi:hypothetical protein